MVFLHIGTSCMTEGQRAGRDRKYRHVKRRRVLANRKAARRFVIHACPQLLCQCGSGVSMTV
ncbi:hypothetical protein CH295_15175 [Rhodococcus sp. 14-2483-1-2]|nr:hypothetical protein CH295_15175 [Rhodococcus sp. 14-2483-1-2]